MRQKNEEIKASKEEEHKTIKNRERKISSISNVA
jgi:hypothetical protein